MRYLVMPLNHPKTADVLVMLSSLGDPALSRLALDIASGRPIRISQDFTHPLITADLGPRMMRQLGRYASTYSQAQESAEADVDPSPGTSPSKSTPNAPSELPGTFSASISITADELDTLLALRRGGASGVTYPDHRGNFAFKRDYMQEVKPDAYPAHWEVVSGWLVVPDGLTLSNVGPFYRRSGYPKEELARMRRLLEIYKQVKTHSGKIIKNIR